MHSHVTGVQLPVLWQKIIKQFLYHATFIPHVAQLFTNSGCLEMLKATEGGPGHVLGGSGLQRPALWQKILTHLRPGHWKLCPMLHVIGHNFSRLRLCQKLDGLIVWFAVNE